MSESTMASQIYECDDCGSVEFEERDSADASGSSCCGGTMQRVEATPVEHPDLAVVLREVFGISETGLKVCLCLMEDGESTAADIGERLDIDRSTVGRQLNHLTNIGVLDKRQRLLKGGGYVNVYSPVPVEEVRKRLTVGLYAWMEEALDIVAHVNREKLDALARADGEGPGGEDADGEPSIYWDE
ncbi:helix-turn-helix domain-containing protein [Halorussus ruber]|uniref:helix-turn-helix domain-containing protein n=1 Tax=Halorussus ruber TaxID=1126238 RepID=UPI001091DF39|nr:helix-turn-helix domain-containing protein [Halorussus ruber]